MTRAIRWRWAAWVVLIGCGGDSSPPIDAAAPLPDAPCRYANEATPSNISFGSVVIGSASIQARITVTNTGTCGTGPLAVEIEGPQADEFGIANQRCTGLDLRPLETCAFDVYYTPMRSGGATARVAVRALPQLNIPLDGNGANPVARPPRPDPLSAPGDAAAWARP